MPNLADRSLTMGLTIGTIPWCGIETKLETQLESCSYHADLSRVCTRGNLTWTHGKRV